MKAVVTEKAPSAVGPYSQAIVSRGMVYTSGQLGAHNDGVIEGDIARQTENAIKNLSEVLVAAGSGLDRVVKTTCYLAKISDFAVFNEVYGRYFSHKPARTLTEATALPKGSLVEIDAIAEIRK